MFIQTTRLYRWKERIGLLRCCVGLFPYRRRLAKTAGSGQQSERLVDVSARSSQRPRI